MVPLVLVACAVSVAVMLLVWRDNASYQPLFGAREQVALGDMAGVLEAEQIPYRLHPETGQVMVPSEMLGQARMRLAVKGITAKIPAGLELVEAGGDTLGASQFLQDVRFRRGLEGELAQSILSLDTIASARVHLAIARSTSFVANDGDKSSASVVVSLKPGRRLDAEQTAAVINLVAGSVAGLAPERVSLVDQQGRLLSARIDLADGFDAAAGEAATRIQREMRANVDSLLGPVIGTDNYQMSVTAEVDQDKVEQTTETYGEAPKVTSEALREEQDKSRLALGVPGTLSNRPPQAAAPSPDSAGSDDNGARKNATTRQYAYDRNVTQVKRSRGRLKRLSVAVVLNHRAAPGPSGWTAAEITKFEQILRSGLGIDETRGDRLAVSTLIFPAVPVPDEWWEQRDNWIEAAAWGFPILGIVLAYLLLARPILRIATTRLMPVPVSSPALAAPPAIPVAEAGSPSPERSGAALGGPVVPLLENYALPPAGSAVDVLVDHLKALADKEPERVAEVVKQWMQKHVRSDA